MSKDLRGSGRVYQRKYRNGALNPIFWIQYYVRGKLYRESSRSSERTVAVKLLKARVGESTNGRLVIAPVAEKVTLGDMLALLRADYEEHRRTVPCFTLNHLLSHFGENARAINIDRDKIFKYVKARREMLIPKLREAANGKIIKEMAPPSDASINREIAALRRAFNLAVESRKLSRDHVPKMPHLEESPARTGFLDPPEFESLTVALPEPLRDPVRFLYASGWRLDAMRRFEWSDCELKRDEHGEIVGGWIYLRAEKSKNRQPYKLPLVGEVLEIIRRAWEARSAACTRVFQRDGAPIGDFKKAWRTAAKAAGCRAILIHDMRRSCARNLIRSGVSTHVAMSVTGHETPSMFRRYNITDDADLESAMTKATEYVAERAQERSKVVLLPLRKSA